MPTAIEIFKFLPKSNCGKCGFPTCLAFAMQLATQKVKLSACPFVSDEAKSALESSSAPPIRLVSVGTGDKKIELGEETELYRHEKKFFHPTCYAVTIQDTLSEAEIDSRLNDLSKLEFERVGQTLRLDMIAVENKSENSETFSSVCSYIASKTDFPLILISSDDQSMKAAASAVSSKKPLLYAADKNNIDSMINVAKETKCPLVLKESDLSELASMAEKAKSAGVEDLMLDMETSSLQQVVEKNTIVRKNAVKKTFRGLGYPIVTDARSVKNPIQTAMVSTMKYGGIVLLENLKPSQALPLFVLRQNIFTDPQVPIQVKAGIYPVNNPAEGSPLLFTTNFSLTYFTVLGDIEKSKIPAWLLVVDTEGLSVMTAFSAGKLTPEKVAKSLEDVDAKTKCGGSPVIMPGMLSRMSGKLQELSGMKVVVGPRESSGIPKILKNL